MILSLITLLNIEYPVVRKESAVDPLVSQTWGMATGGTLNSMGVLWTYFYSMRTTDVELKDYSGIYWIFRTWSGLFVFVCLGLASKPFKAALLGQVKNNANLASILSNLTDPVRSRKDDSDFEDIDDEVSSDSDISSDSLDEEGD